MTPVLAVATSGDFLRGLLGVAGVVAFPLTAVMLVVAFAERRKRPVAARKLARATMAVAVLAVVVCVGGLSLTEGDVESAWAMGVTAPAIAIWQAVVFCVAWVLSREPRATRPSAD